MAHDFEVECDRLSQSVDSVQFERIRWARNEGPMLDRLVALARTALESRSEFELSEEGTAGARKRFVLKVHSLRVVALNIALDGRTVAVWGEAIDRSKYRLPNAQRRAADYQDIDEAWMKAAIGGILSEIE